MMKQHILSALNDSQSALANFISNADNIVAIENSAHILIETLNSSHTIYSCGNGGSMSDAMHFAEEITGRYRKNRKALPACAISDPGHISCVANDFGYEYIFSRYLEGCSISGDALLAISTSGKSPNVIKAAQFARNNGIKVISLIGQPDCPLAAIADVNIAAGKADFADRIQELHIKIIHILIELIEREFFPEDY